MSNIKPIVVVGLILLVIVIGILIVGAALNGFYEAIDSVESLLSKIPFWVYAIMGIIGIVIFYKNSQREKD